MIEKTIERLIFASRWLMAPFYIGLIAVLAMLMIKFAQELLHFIPHVFDLKEPGACTCLLYTSDAADEL